MSSNDPWADLGSRLPSEDAYWDDLARRVQEDVAPMLESMRPPGSPLLTVAARYAVPLAVLAMAAMASALTLFQPSTHESAAEGMGMLARTIEPVHPGLGGLSGHAPPSLETILLQEGVVEP